MSTRIMAALMGVALSAPSAFAQSQQSDKLQDYLVDIGAGPVSAADLIGVSATAVTNVQSLKDLNVLFSPSAGTGQEAGVGLQVAPFRTQWSGLSARDYADSASTRLLGALSLSYAQNKAKYNDVEYRQQAVALHAAYYYHREDDPIYAAHAAFAHCAITDIEVKKGEGLLALIAQARKALGREPTQEEKDRITVGYLASPDFAKLVDDADQAVKKCVADAARDKWNATLFTATLGGAWIRPDTGGGSNLSLARSLSLAGVVGVGESGAVNLLARLNRHELDLDTLAGVPSYKNRTLVAARYTYRGNKDSTLYGLAEVSNAKGSQATISDSAFKYALGLDAKLFDSVWLEFRVGRARSSNSSSGDETKALASLKWSSTPSLPTLFSSK